jgi:hypothetical protein
MQDYDPDGLGAAVPKFRRAEVPANDVPADPADPAEG